MPDDSAHPPDARTATRWVRLREARSDGFVEFEFAIGDPELCVELILPRRAYDAFCREQRAHLVDAELGRRLDAARERWQYGRPAAASNNDPGDRE